MIDENGSGSDSSGRDENDGCFCGASLRPGHALVEDERKEEPNVKLVDLNCSTCME